MKLLLARPSPRCNIPQVEQAWEELNVDRVEARYMNHYEAVQKCRNYFLEHADEYDYLVICSDDMIIEQKHVDMLTEDLARLRPEVLTGMINVDEEDWDKEDGFVNLSHELPKKHKPERVYSFLHKSELPDADIFRVKFSGFPLTAIRNDIARVYPFHSDTCFKVNRKVSEGQQFDLVFCHYCNENNIPIHVDKRIYMQHLRDSGESQVGKRGTQFVVRYGR